MRRNDATLAVSQLVHCIKVKTQLPWTELKDMLAFNQQSSFLPVFAQGAQLANADAEMLGHIGSRSPDGRKFGHGDMCDRPAAHAAQRTYNN